MDRMLHEMEAFAPTLLEANPSYLARLSHHALLGGLRVFQPKAVILTYELPSAIHRRLIQRVFRCPVVSSYGTTESGYVFMQCEHGRLHQNTRFCHVDFVPVDGNTGGNPLGRLVVTTFRNPWRMLLRFVTGDLGRLDAEPCPCGRREGLVLRRIEGREHNVTMSAAAKIITEAEVDDSLSAVEGILDYQVFCRRGGPVSCHVVPTGCTSLSEVLSSAEKSLELLYGPSEEARVNAVAEIPPTVSGKYRRIIPAPEGG
jgi:phenylacetate-CoA ligase